MDGVTLRGLARNLHELGPRRHGRMMHPRTTATSFDEANDHFGGPRRLNGPRREAVRQHDNNGRTGPQRKGLGDSFAHVCAATAEQFDLGSPTDPLDRMHLRIARQHADVCSPEPNSLEEGLHFRQDLGEEIPGHRTRCVADDGDIGYRAFECRHDHRRRRLRPYAMVFGTSSRPSQRRGRCRSALGRPGRGANRCEMAGLPRPTATSRPRLTPARVLRTAAFRSQWRGAGTLRLAHSSRSPEWSYPMVDRCHHTRIRNPIDAVLRSGLTRSTARPGARLRLRAPRASDSRSGGPFPPAPSRRSPPHRLPDSRPVGRRQPRRLRRDRRGEPWSRRRCDTRWTKSRPKSSTAMASRTTGSA